MKKLLIVFGTRPEAIKMAPIVKEFEKYPDIYNVSVCVTGQHREMLDQVLKIFDIVPQYDLNIMLPGQDLYDITSKVIMGMRSILNEYKPELVMVHGDTTTAMATTIAAFYQQIKVAHVEAGLRTFDIYSPWPEEMNRQVVDRLSRFCFAPTKTSKDNLLREGIDEKMIFVTGNTVIDALFLSLNAIVNNSELEKAIRTDIKEKGYTIKPNKKIILITGHRRENFGDGFLQICEAIKEIAENNPDIDLVYPVHLNPNVQIPVFDILREVPNVYLISPLTYQPFIYLMKSSFIILTDSGGVQEEAPSLGKPVLVMREVTERPEAVEAGTVKLVGTCKEKIVNEISFLLKNSNFYNQMSLAHNPYGDGKASEKIRKIIDDNLI